jgi:hypothetical protein
MLRSASKYWFGYITLDEFTIYFASPTTLPAIAQHFLQQYGDRAIGLYFEKVVVENAAEYPVSLLSGLTHLTSLHFNFGRNYSVGRDLTKLTSLTNLLSTSARSIPGLTNLTSLETTPEAARNVLHRFTNLREMKLEIFGDYDPLGLIANPGKLTSLTVRSYGPKHVLNERTMAQFTNLKTLRITPGVDEFVPYSLGLINLENLEILNGSFKERVGVTRLTRLFIRARSCNHQELSCLQRLKFLSIQTSPKDEDCSFLQLMTDLEHLITTPSAHMTGDGLNFLNSRKLTSLTVTEISELFNVDHLSRLTTLVELCIRERSEASIPKSYDGLTSLINLRSLYLATQTPDSVRLTVLNSLTNLKELTFNNTVPQPIFVSEDITFRKLLNLEMLKLGCPPSQSIYDDIYHLTRLTSLTIDLPVDVFERNPTVLNNIPLKKLIFNRPLQSPKVWDLVTRLTDLEYLQVWRVTSEEIIESFSVLTNLTRLAMLRSPSVKGVHLTKLTGLQHLFFISSAAKKTFAKSNALFERLTRLTCLELK